MLPLRDRVLPGARPSRLVMGLGMLLLLLLVMLMVIAPDRLLHLRSLLVFVHVLAGNREDGAAGVYGLGLSWFSILHDKGFRV